MAEESLDSVAVKIEYGVVPNDRVTGKRRREDDVDLAEKCFNDVAVKIEQGAVPNDRVTGKRRREDDVDEDDTSETDGGGGEDVGDQVRNGWILVCWETLEHDELVECRLLFVFLLRVVLETVLLAPTIKY